MCVRARARESALLICSMPSSCIMRAGTRTYEAQTISAISEVAVAAIVRRLTNSAHKHLYTCVDGYIGAADRWFVQRSSQMSGSPKLSMPHTHTQNARIYERRAIRVGTVQHTRAKNKTHVHSLGCILRERAQTSRLEECQQQRLRTGRM